MPGPKRRNMAPERKPKNAGATVKRLLKYLGKNKALLIGMIIFVILSSVAMVVLSVVIKPIVDDLLIPAIGQKFSLSLFAGVKKQIIIMGAMAILSVASSYFKAKCSVLLTARTMNLFRKDIFDSISVLPIKFYDTRPNGEIMSRFTNDVESVRMFLSQGISQLISSTVTIVGSFIVMFLLSPVLTVLVVVMVALMVVITKFLGKKSAFYFKKQQQDIGVVNGYIEEIIEGQKVVKVFNHEEETIDRFNDINENLRKASTGANTFASVLMPLMNNLGHVNYAITAAFGGVLAIKGFMTPGSIVTFLQNSRNFSQPISNLSQQFNNAIMAIAGAERIFEYIDEQPETDEGYVTLVNAKKDENGVITETDERTGLWAWKHIHQADGTVEYIELRGKVEFENVTFSYDGKKTVLDDISLYAKPGQKIAFVGSTGAGKTTITNLINRFYEINNGKIRYDGINIQKIKKDDLRRSLGMVLQDTHLFTGTVKDNIRYGNLDATDEQIENAAKLANAHEFIMALPEGYDTVLQSDGGNLSQGQRQLLSIARAAVSDPPVLILDEATSSIDTRTEKLIEQGMDKLMAGRTVFVIAHRLSTVRNANAIMVLEHGKIIERGDHDDLLSQKGRYYQLYTGQFELS
ncbi:MAG: ABC transporter ATP-binding protein [Oscillospiraceae bacterium]|nr:ABC transporter ATP-binding protein [Oscillospiraceae bacterium]